jgi:hypothetical protein
MSPGQVSQSFVVFQEEIATFLENYIKKTPALVNENRKIFMRLLC